MVGWEAQSWQVQETEDSEQTGSGDSRIGVAGSGNRWFRFRRQKTHSRQDQETGGSEWQGQVTGGSGSGDIRLIADRIRRQEDRSGRVR